MNMKPTIVAAAICLMCVAAVPLLRSQDSDSSVVAAITQLENDGIKGALANDISVVKNNLTENYVAGTSFGKWETKASLIEDAKNPADNKTNSASLSDLKVNVYGNTTAVARFVNTYDDIYHGQHRSRSVMCTDTWVNDGGKWKLAADHCSQKVG